MKRNDTFKWFVEHPDFLSNSEISKIKEHLINEREAKLVSGYDQKDTVSEVREYRKALEYDYNENWLKDKIEFIVKVANQKTFNYDLNSQLEPIKVLKYKVDDKYDWHPDFGRGEESIRKLSIIVQLSDSNEYEGGDLEFGLTTKENNTFLKGTRKKGTIIIFNSMLIHRIRPVKLGVRYSLLTWAHGNTFK